MPTKRRQSSKKKRDEDDDDGSEDEVVEEEEDPDKPLCLCRQPYRDGEFMVCCDVCEEWFHPRCVGTTEEALKRLDKFFCPNCKPEGSTPRKRQAASPASSAKKGSAVATPKAQPPKKEEEAARPAGRKRPQMDTPTAAATPKNSTYDDARRTTVQNIAASLGDHPRSQEIASKIDIALHDQFKGVLKQYGPRARTLLFNLRDKQNKALRDKLLCGELSPEYFAIIPTDQIVAKINAHQPLHDQQPAPNSSTAALPEPKRESAATAITDPLEGEEPMWKRPKSMDESSAGKAVQGAPVWTGRIEKTEKNFTPFAVNGFFVAGLPYTSAVLPPVLEVSGRLEIAKLFQYLHMLSTSGTRKRSVFRLDPVDASDSSQYGSLFSYFTQRQRAGYVKPPKDTPTLEELYIVPLSRQERLPDFLKADSSLDMGALYAGDLSSMLLLAVVTRPHTLSPSVVAVPHPAQPPATQLTQPAPTTAAAPVAPVEPTAAPAISAPAPAPAAPVAAEAPKAPEHPQDAAAHQEGKEQGDDAQKQEASAAEQADTDAKQAGDGDDKEEQEPKKTDGEAPPS